MSATTDGEYLIEPHAHSTCLMSRCVSKVGTDQTVPLTVTNLSDFPVVVESNTLLGSASLLGTDMEAEVCAAADVSDGLPHPLKSRICLTGQSVRPRHSSKLI